MAQVMSMENRPTQYKDIYFCLSSQAKVGKIINGKTYAARHKDDALALKAVWLDIDVKEPPKGYASLEEADEPCSNSATRQGYLSQPRLWDQGVVCTSTGYPIPR